MEWKSALVVGLAQAAVLTDKTGRVATNSRLVKDITWLLISKSHELKLAVVQVQQWLTDVSATRGWNGLDDGLGLAAECAERAESLIAELAMLHPSQRALCDNMRHHFADYYETGRRMAQTYVDQGTEAGNRYMVEFDRAAESLQDDVASAMQAATATSAAAPRQSVELADEVRYWIRLTTLLLMALPMTAGAYLFRVVLCPVCLTAHRAQQLVAGDGDLTRRLEAQRNDELGEVAQAISTFVEKIKNTVAVMRSVATQLGDSSGHLTQVAREGQAMAANQLGETEAVATAMTEMKAMADEIARTAGETADYTESASVQTKSGSAAVQRASGS